MADFSKLGGLPGLRYGESTLDQTPVVRNPNAGAIYEDVSRAAEQVGQVFRERSNEQAKIAGEKAVTRDADGNIQVSKYDDGGFLGRLFLPENAEIYHNAAQLRYLSETSTDITNAVTRAHIEHPEDKEGFDAAVSGIKQSFLGNIPGELGDPARIAPHIDDAINRLAGQHGNDILETKARSDLAKTVNAVGAQLEDKKNDLGVLARSGALDTPEAQRLIKETNDLIRSKVNNPAFDYSPERADLDVRELQSTLKGEALIGHVEQTFKEKGFDAAKAEIDNLSKDTSLELTPETRDKLEHEGNAIITHLDTEQKQAAAEQQDRRFADLNEQAELQKLTLKQIHAEYDAGRINPAQRRALTDKVIVKTADDSKLREAMDRLVKNFPMDPSNETDRKAGDKVFEAMVAKGGDPLAIATRMAQVSGLVPSVVMSRLRGSSLSQNPAVVSDGLNAGRALIEAAPDALDKMPGGNKLADDSELYRHLTRDLGQSEQEAAQRIIKLRDPAERQRSKTIVDDSAGDIRKLTINDALGATGARGTGFFGAISNLFGGAAAPGLDKGQESLILGDYKALLKERLAETGDMDSAKALAGKDMQRVYGVTSAFGKPALMKYPPEARYPKVNGSYDYVRDQAAEDARAVFKDPNIKPEDVHLSWDSVTAQDFSAGRLPRYTISVNRNGTWVTLPSGYFQADPKKVHADPTVSPKAKFDAQRKTTVDTLTMPNVTPGL